MASCEFNTDICGGVGGCSGVEIFETFPEDNVFLDLLWEPTEYT